MSFWPLPRTLTEPLLTAAAGRITVELGAGAGALAARLRRVGLHICELDRRAAPSASGRRVCADAFHLPFRSASLSAVVLGNFLRHVKPVRRAALTSEIWNTVRPGGIVLVLEDDPAATNPAERTYRDVLDRLARIDVTRGGAIGAAGLTEDLARGWGRPEVVDHAENEETVRDPREPIRWLQAHGDLGTGDLADDIARHGMRYGRFWGAIFRKGSQ